MRLTKGEGTVPKDRAVPPALQDFFAAHPRLAVAFSGGADSAYLLYAAAACGCEAEAFYVHSAFQPAFELRDARRMAEGLNVPLHRVPVDILALDRVRANPADRCYHCKRALFGALAEAARARGFEQLADGTNASDDAGDRPGMRALTEMGVLSPLRLCGVTKAEVRQYSRQAGLFTWNKPACACLATRIPTGTPIEAEALRRVEAAEDALFALGFSDLRVRLYHGAARLQLPAEQLERAVGLREEIRGALAPHFDAVLLDLKER